jgi:hypothetical protein
MAFYLSNIGLSSLTNERSKQTSKEAKKRKSEEAKKAKPGTKN